MSLITNIYRSDDHPQHVKVELQGKLDSHTAPLLDEELAPLLTQNITRLVFDLAHLDYISSAGLRSIFRARKAIQAKKGQSFVVNPQPSVQKVFEIVKAVPIQEIFKSVEELDEYLDLMQRKARDDL